MQVAQEEIFGPVAVVIKFHDENEVIGMANDSVYGLGGAVWTRDLNRAIRVARAVETGRMWVNTYNQDSEGSFSGYKGFRHRPQDAQDHPRALHADEEHHD